MTENQISELSLGEWVAMNPGLRAAKVSSGLKYPPLNPTKSKLNLNFLTGSRTKQYAIRSDSMDAQKRPSQDENAQEFSNISHRSYKDFQTLRDLLALRYPGSFVPLLPKSKTKSAMNLFLGYIIGNPFLRNDDSVDLFLNPEIKNYSSARKITSLRSNKADGPASVGSMRWKQALSAFKFSQNGKLIAFDNNDDIHATQIFLGKLKDELKLVLNTLKLLQSNVLRQMEIQESQAVVYSELSSVFDGMIAAESNFDMLKFPDSRKVSSLKKVSELTARSVHDQTCLFQKEYGSPVLQKRLLDPIEQQIDIAQLWMKHISSEELKLKALSALIRKESLDLKPYQMLEIEKKKHDMQQEILTLFQGLFGVELEMYRNYRNSKIKRILYNLSCYHLIGAEQTFSVWDRQKGVLPHDLDEYELNEICLKKMHKKNNILIQKNLKFQQKFEPVFLKVKSVSKKGNRYLKAHVDEVIVGHPISEKKEFWLAVSSSGERGLILKTDTEVIQRDADDLSSNRQLQSQVKVLQNTPVDVPELKDSQSLDAQINPISLNQTTSGSMNMEANSSGSDIDPHYNGEDPDPIEVSVVPLAQPKSQPVIMPTASMIEPISRNRDNSTDDPKNLTKKRVETGSSTLTRSLLNQKPSIKLTEVDIPSNESEFGGFISAKKPAEVVAPVVRPEDIPKKKPSEVEIAKAEIAHDNNYGFLNKALSFIGWGGASNAPVLASKGSATPLAAPEATVEEKDKRYSVIEKNTSSRSNGISGAKTMPLKSETTLSFHDSAKFLSKERPKSHQIFANEEPTVPGISSSTRSVSHPMLIKPVIQAKNGTILDPPIKPSLPGFLPEAAEIKTKDIKVSVEPKGLAPLLPEPVQASDEPVAANAPGKVHETIPTPPAGPTPVSVVQMERRPPPLFLQQLKQVKKEDLLQKASTKESSVSAGNVVNSGKSSLTESNESATPVAVRSPMQGMNLMAELKSATLNRQQFLDKKKPDVAKFQKAANQRASVSPQDSIMDELRMKMIQRRRFTRENFDPDEDEEK